MGYYIDDYDRGRDVPDQDAICPECGRAVVRRCLEGTWVTVDPVTGNPHALTCVKPSTED